MAFLSSLDIAGSGMTAQKRRLDTISENITNRETLRTENGGPYRRKLTVFREIGKSRSQSFGGIMQRYTDSFGTERAMRYRSRNDGGTKGGVMVTEIIEDPTDFIPVYDPNHPDADENGYVYMPNVDTTVEMVDAMAATRSYSANIAAFEAMKSMAKMALEIGK